MKQNIKTFSWPFAMIILIIINFDAIPGPISGLQEEYDHDIIPLAKQQQCPRGTALDPFTLECDPIRGECPEGETRGEDGYCAPMPEDCPPGTKIFENPRCKPTDDYLGLIFPSDSIIYAK